MRNFLVVIALIFTGFISAQTGPIDEVNRLTMTGLVELSTPTLATRVLVQDPITLETKWVTVGDLPIVGGGGGGGTADGVVSNVTFGGNLLNFTGFNGGFDGSLDLSSILNAPDIISLGFATGAHTVDTNTQLSQLDIEGMGFVTGAHTVDTNTQLTQADIEAFGFVGGAHTTNTDSQSLSLSGNNLVISGGNFVNLAQFLGSDNQTATEVSVFPIVNTNSDVQSVLEDLDSRIAALAAGGSDGVVTNIELVGNTLVVDGTGGAEDTNVDLSSLAVDTQLTQAQIESMGFVTGAHTVDTNTDAQTLSISGTNLSINNGNTVDLSGLGGGGGTDDQTATEVSVSPNVNSNGDVQTVLEDLDSRVNTLASGGSDGVVTSITLNNAILQVGGTGGAFIGNIDLGGIDTNTQLGQTDIENFGFVTGSHFSGDYNDLTNQPTIPTDTNTQLSQTDIENFGFVTGAHTVNTDNQNLTISGNSLSITGGNTIDLSGIESEKYYAFVDTYGAIGNNSPSSASSNADAMQLAIDSDKNIVIFGTDKSEIYYIDKPLKLLNNKTYIINATIKTIDSEIRDLTASMIVGDNTVSVANADTYFRVGQQIAVSDDVQQIQGGSLSQTRRFGQSWFVSSVTNNSVTFGYNSLYNYTLANNAKIGHTQSVFYSENPSNITIKGEGAIDQNYQNGYDIYNVAPKGVFGEAFLFGCGISFDGGSGFDISGIEVKNALLHDISFWQSNEIKINDVLLKDSHDKNVLFYKCSDISITNSVFDGSELEDGIALYQGNSNVVISDVTLKNHRRFGILMGGATDATNNVTISNVLSIGTKTAISSTGGENIRISNVTVKDWGYDYNLSQPSDGIFLSGVKDVQLTDIKLIDSDANGVDNGVRILNNSEDIVLTNLKVIVDQSNSGNQVGVMIDNTGGHKNIQFINPSIQGAFYGVRAMSGTNITFQNGIFVGNTTPISNFVGRELKTFNTVGADLYDNYLNKDLFVDADIINTGKVTTPTLIADKGAFGSVTIPSASIHTNEDIYAIGNGNRRFLVGESLSTSKYGGIRWNDALEEVRLGHSGYSPNLTNIRLLSNGNVRIDEWLGIGREPTQALDIVDGNVNLFLGTYTQRQAVGLNKFRLINNRNGEWGAGDEQGAVVFESSDVNSGGTGDLAKIASEYSENENTLGNHSDLVLYTRDGFNGLTEGARITNKKDLKIIGSTSSTTYIAYGKTSNDILLGDGTTTSLSAIVGGGSDDLGNHTATTNLDMATFNLEDATQVESDEFVLPNGIENSGSSTSLVLENNVHGTKYYTRATPSTDASFTVASNTVADAFTQVYIDTTGATDFPTVTNSTEIQGAGFKGNSLFKIVIFEEEGSYYHYFLAW